jgi:hypothetical protein
VDQAEVAQDLLQDWRQAAVTRSLLKPDKAAEYESALDVVLGTLDALDPLLRTELEVARRGKPWLKW